MGRRPAAETRPDVRRAWRRLPLVALVALAVLALADLPRASGSAARTRAHAAVTTVERDGRHAVVAEVAPATRPSAPFVPDAGWIAAVASLVVAVLATIVAARRVARFRVVACVAGGQRAPPSYGLLHRP